MTSITTIRLNSFPVDEENAISKFLNILLQAIKLVEEDFSEDGQKRLQELSEVIDCGWEKNSTIIVKTPVEKLDPLYREVGFNSSLNKILMGLCVFGRVEILKNIFRLVDGIDVNKINEKGETIFSEAVIYTQKEIVEFLLEDPSLNINQVDFNNHTSLSWACIKGNSDIVKLLVDRSDIAVNFADKDGKTAFWRVCAQGGSIAVLEALLQNPEVRINQTDRFNRTPLFMASYAGHQKIVEFLLTRREIQINIRSVSGETAMIVAKKRKFDKIAILFREYRKKMILVNFEIKEEEELLDGEEFTHLEKEEAQKEVEASWAKSCIIS